MAATRDSKLTVEIGVDASKAFAETKTISNISSGGDFTSACLARGGVRGAGHQLIYTQRQIEDIFGGAHP